MYLCAVNNKLADIMPRQERLHSATGIYHVMLRGINKQDIFEDDEDYIQFLKILNGLVDRHDDDGHVLPAHCTFYAYCLMTNHIHLLMRELDEQIGESVKRIGVAYARYYNRKYERNGHLFQDRFLSEPVNNIEYFMTLMRYIHQNPVHAGLAAEVRDYPWSSWAEYEGMQTDYHICKTSPVIKRLDKTNLYEFVTMPVDSNNILDIDYGIGVNITDDDIKGKIAEISGLQLPTEVQNLAKSERNTILKQLCEYGANIRQISRVTGISYGVIYRAKSGS